MRKALLLRFVFVAVLIPFLQAEVYAIDVGDIAPEFSAVTINGKVISYEGELKGKRPVYLVFWSTW